MTRTITLAFVLTVTFGCSEPTSVPSTSNEEGDSSLPRLLEGLPHRIEDSFSTEKQRPDAEELHGYWFYTPSVSFADDDFNEIAKILHAEGSLKKWMGEKLCDGFHPDWLVRLTRDDEQATYLICFGCHEAKVVINGKVTRYDLSDTAYASLTSLLKEKRVNRPVATPGGEYLR